MPSVSCLPVHETLAPALEAYLIANVRKNEGEPDSVA